VHRISKGYISSDKVIAPVDKGLVVPVVIGLAAGVCLILAISYSVAWSIAPSSSATKDNPLGFAARVALVRNFSYPCLRGPCHEIDTSMFKSVSAERHWFLGRVICNANHYPPCFEGFSASTSSAKSLDLPPCRWGMSTIGQVDWHAGETVHIWVKLAPYDSEEDSSQIDPKNVRWVDLGESEIFEYNQREFRATGHC
jgi:hypothetical protein